MTTATGPSLTERARGAMLGLAACDALGTTLEFTGPLDPFTPQVTQIVGGGPFKLPPGGWTDDTSMALCLGQSLVALGGCDPRDQIERYVRWWRDGENSITGHCFDIGNTTVAALRRFVATGEPLAGDPRADAAGNGSLMRLAPVALAAASEEQAVEWAGLQSRTTHAAPVAVDSCRFYARLIWRALRGAPKAALLDPAAADGLELVPDVDAVARGSYREKAPPAIRGTGYVVDALEAALWAFHVGDTFEAGALLAVNLGEDSDTTGAIFGQIAGAHYGLDAIPAAWRRAVLWSDQILKLADDLVAMRP
jgi:ADP-ribosylglycohydrolase